MARTLSVFQVATGLVPAAQLSRVNDVKTWASALPLPIWNQPRAPGRFLPVQKDDVCCRERKPHLCLWEITKRQTGPRRTATFSFIHQHLPDILNTITNITKSAVFFHALHITHYFPPPLEILIYFFVDISWASTPRMASCQQSQCFAVLHHRQIWKSRHIDTTPESNFCWNHPKQM